MQPAHECGPVASCGSMLLYVNDGEGARGNVIEIFDRIEGS